MSGADERARHDATADKQMPREADADRQARLRFEASLPDHAARNRAWWDADSERYQAVQGQQLREAGGSAWGVWQIPEAELRILGDVAGLATVELGCGAAQWSIALAKAGATAIGVDLSEAQLRAAWAAANEAGVAIRLIHASAEALPLPDASADIAFCDWGASRFADPDAWVPEAARILRPGGLLAFSTASPLVDMCWAAGADAPTESLVIDAFGLDRVVDDETIEFQRTNGAWIALFRDQGLLVEDLIELRAPAEARSSYWDDVAHAWARRWPAEQIWRLRRES
jgi:SAM-dependent methyltransferase